MERFLYSDGGLATVVGLIAAALGALFTVYQAHKDAWERRQVIVSADRPVAVARGPGKAYEVTLSVRNTGNRPTVIRDVRLVGKDKQTLLSYRRNGGSRPLLPLRLDAPDERDITFEVLPDDQRRLGVVELDVINDAKPIEVVQWPYNFLEAPPLEGSSDVRGNLDVKPTPPASTAPAPATAPNTPAASTPPAGRTGAAKETATPAPSHDTIGPPPIEDPKK